MPQLNPSPWLAILILTWIVFLVILPQVVLGHTFPNEITVQDIDSFYMSPWNWPWF